MEEGDEEVRPVGRKKQKALDRGELNERGNAITNGIMALIESNNEKLKFVERGRDEAMMDRDISTVTDPLYREYREYERFMVLERLIKRKQLVREERQRLMDAQSHQSSIVQEEDNNGVVNE